MDRLEFSWRFPGPAARRSCRSRPPHSPRQPLSGFRCSARGRRGVRWWPFHSRQRSSVPPGPSRLDLRLIVAAGAVIVATAGMAFAMGPDQGNNVGRYQRILFASVFIFAGWVAAWGWFQPGAIGRALPISAPPLHARFLGAMYLSGCCFMLLALMARAWREIVVAVAILAVWTGMLGLVSILNVAAFDWSRDPTWFWFVAYLGFPLLAAWVLWCQRGNDAEASGPPAPPVRASDPRRVGRHRNRRRDLPAVRARRHGDASGRGRYRRCSPRSTARRSWPTASAVCWRPAASAGPKHASRCCGTLDVRGRRSRRPRACIQGRSTACSPSTWVWFCGFGLAVLALAGDRGIARRPGCIQRAGPPRHRMAPSQIIATP